MDFLTHEINNEIIRTVQSLSNPILDQILKYITSFGGEVFFILAIALVYWCIDKKLGFKLLFILTTSMAINTSIKGILKIPRPIGEKGLRLIGEVPIGYSFPSGHTQVTTTFWVSLMKNIKNRYTYLIGTLMIILVGFSRIALGVHRPVDVIGGAFIGLFCVIFFGSLFENLDFHNYKFIVIIINIIILICLVFFREKDYYIVAALYTSFSIAYYVEPIYIDFYEKAPILGQISKFTLGILLFLIIRIVLKLIFPNFLIFTYLRYLILGLWMTLGAPIMFKKIGLS